MNEYERPRTPPLSLSSFGGEDGLPAEGPAKVGERRPFLLCSLSFLLLKSPLRQKIPLQKVGFTANACKLPKMSAKNQHCFANCNPEPDPENLSPVQPNQAC